MAKFTFTIEDVRNEDMELSLKASRTVEEPEEEINSTEDGKPTMAQGVSVAFGYLLDNPQEIAVLLGKAVAAHKAKAKATEEIKDVVEEGETKDD